MSKQIDTDMNNTEAELDQWLDKSNAPLGYPSEKLVARLISDAENVLKGSQREPASVSSSIVDAFIADVLPALLNWRNASVLTASAILGVTIGYSSIDNLGLIPGGVGLAETFTLDLDDAVDRFTIGISDTALFEG